MTSMASATTQVVRMGRHSWPPHLGPDQDIAVTGSEQPDSNSMRIENAPGLI